MILTILIVLCSLSNAFASDLNDLNLTIEQNDDVIEDTVLVSQKSSEIEVDNWDDIQYYASLSDKNYVLKLKENTNYYPTNVASTDSQIIFNNNVTVIGSNGAYIGDSSPNPRNITYTAMKVPDNSGIGITFKGVTFKWISSSYQPDGLFLIMGGNSVNYFEDCYFTDISTKYGHSAILQIKLGDAVLTNCSFINCTNDFGCLSICNPNDNPTTLRTLARMNVSDSYFEGNYARTAPGCINNCGILVVRNSTFCKNSAFWWAGAIHTTGGSNTTLYDCLFTDNVAGWNGGALYTYSYLQIFNTTFINNNCTTGNGGGAIGACKYQHAPYIYVQDSRFINNENTCWGTNELSSGTGRGGAISIMDEGGIEVRNTTFIKNSASMGTAICAISGGNYGSPDVVIVGNTFINHTRVGDVLDIRIASSSYLEISDNYYYNNSFEYKKLRLLADEKVGDEVVIHIDAELKNPVSFEKDILDTTSYDIYVDGEYNKTVIGRTFTLTLKDGKTCNVYAAPSIANSVTNEILVGTIKEYVYVSQKSGNDANDGFNRSTPVKTLTKAIEIAKSKGNIVIMDGAFNESGFVIDYNLNVIGEDNVRFTGSMANTIFTVSNKYDLSLSNLAFDGIIFTNKNAGIIRQSSGFTTVDGCVFNNNYVVSSLTGTNLIEAKNIEIYNSNFTDNNKKYVTLIKANEFLIDNCTFRNNLASQTTYNSLISTSGEKAGVKGSISDSIFESNSVMYGCIYFDSGNFPLTITNTKFIANRMTSNNGHSSCIKLENSPTLRIESSVFMDNVDLGSKSSAIYVAGGYASVYVSNSIILNNSYENTNNLVFSASTASNLNVYKNLDGNWWGNTWQDYTVAPPAYGAACNSWILLNMTSNATELAINQKALISIDFFNSADRNNDSFFRDAGKLPEFDLDVDGLNGTVSSSKVSLIKGSGSVEYTLERLTRGSITVNYKNVGSTLNFNWALIGADIGIDVSDSTYGNATQIMIAAPDDIDESKIALMINNISYDFKRNIVLSNLNAGQYLINLTYDGDSKYCQKTYEKQFKVEKAFPQFNVTVDEAYYGNPVKITLTSNSDLSGDIAISIGDIHDQKAVSDGKVEFAIGNMAADNYTVYVRYFGDENYLFRNLTSNFEVKKYNSTVTISKGNVELGCDVVLTFTLNSDASGNITVNINGKKENVAVSGGNATYVIKNISRGLYSIEATYNGDVKYLASKDATEIDVGRLNADMVVDVKNITYGEDAIFTVTLNDASSGNITVDIDGKSYVAAVNGGRASLNISDLTAGDKVADVSYSGDFNYMYCKTTKSFNIAKAKPALTIEVSDIKVGKTLNVKITITKGVTGTLEIITFEGTENAQIPRTGLFTRTLSDLSVGEYNVSAIYAGDDNYLGVEAVQTFRVSAWDTPQWPNEGYDTKNTEKSPYSSDANGNVAWIRDIDGDIIGNMAIDSEGNIYIATSVGIYSLKSTDCSINWIFKSNDAGYNFSGVAIGRDMILSPKSGHKLFFINQTTGMALNNNIFQGSSVFAPVVDENANIYITSEYQSTTSCYNLVIVPYDIWEFSTAPILIDIGKTTPTTSPVLINNNTVAVATQDSLKIVDISSKSVSNSFKITTNVRPVVSDNILYTIADNCIVAITPSGNILKISISGTAGNYLSVGENGEIFAITKQGVLYEYSTGEEVFIHDFKSNVSQALLVGQNGALYVGCENGQFHSIDVDGNLLWKVNLNESLSGIPVMDENGMIYVISGNRIVAINNTVQKGSGLSADIESASYKEDVKAVVRIDGEATGAVSLSIGDACLNESAIENGEASFVISNLNAGNYTAKITYAGDSRFKSESIEVKFKVSKINPTMKVEYGNITVGKVLNVKVSDLPHDATGKVSLSINGKTYEKEVRDGIASFNVDALAKGNHDFKVAYAGDSNYDGANYLGSVGVLESIISNDMTRAYNSGTDFKATLFDMSLNKLSNADVEVIVDGNKLTLRTDDDGVLILDNKLAVGNHFISITNPATSEVASNTVVIVKRLANNANLVMDYGDGSKFKVRVYGDDGNVVGANEIVVMKIGAKSYNVKTDKDGWASLSVSFTPKTYSITSEYKGFKVSNTITVKSVIKAKNLSKKKSKTIKYSITLKNSKNKALKSKKVTFKFRGKTYSAKTNKKGVATVVLKNIKVGKFNIKITYLKHTVTKKITIKK